MKKGLEDDEASSKEPLKNPGTSVSFTGDQLWKSQKPISHQVRLDQFQFQDPNPVQSSAASTPARFEAASTPVRLDDACSTHFRSGFTFNPSRSNAASTPVRSGPAHVRLDANWVPVRPDGRAQIPQVGIPSFFDLMSSNTGRSGNDNFKPVFGRTGSKRPSS